MHDYLGLNLSTIVALDVVGQADGNWHLSIGGDATMADPTASFTYSQGDAGESLGEAVDDEWIHRQSLESKRQTLKAEAEWQAGIAAVDDLLRGNAVAQESDGPGLGSGSDYGSGSGADSGPDPEPEPGQGLILSGPLPTLETPAIVGGFSTWVFTPPLGGDHPWLQRQIQPAGFIPEGTHCDVKQLALFPKDPLAEERFCLVLTPAFSVVLVLGKDDDGTDRFQFSFSPLTIQKVWYVLRSRVKGVQPQYLATLDALVQQFPPQAPHYQQVVTFSRLLLNHRPEVPRVISADGVSPLHRSQHKPSLSTQPLMGSYASNASGGHASGGYASGGYASGGHASGGHASGGHASGGHWEPLGDPSASPPSAQPPSAQPEHAGGSYPGTQPYTALSSDAELLQVMAHEIRTPLATIRTLVRSLLRRKDMVADIAKRLKMIDRECTQQIDRFSLIFKAVEVATTAQASRPRSPLTPISLTRIFQDSIPRWEQQASRRGLTLDVSLPAQLPMVASDPTLLTQVLTGLVERCTNGLAPNSHIQLQVIVAGHQLKLQFEPQCAHGSGEGVFSGFHRPSLRSIGQLLMFQPETGGLSLNLKATKNLFQAMGGKLIVRRHPQRGEVLTVFLPLDTAPII